MKILITIFKVILLPVAGPCILLMAWVACIMTWGLMGYKDALTGMWNDYWRSE